MGHDYSRDPFDPVAFELTCSSSCLPDHLEYGHSGGTPFDGQLRRDTETPLPPSKNSSYSVEARLTRVYAGAAPLAPLRTRDVAVLEEWFMLDSMAEIEADIMCNLLLRFPEPCWEDYVFDFLGEFL